MYNWSVNNKSVKEGEAKSHFLEYSGHELLLQICWQVYINDHWRNIRLRCLYQRFSRFPHILYYFPENHLLAVYLTMPNNYLKCSALKNSNLITLDSVLTTYGRLLSALNLYRNADICRIKLLHKLMTFKDEIHCLKNVSMRTYFAATLQVNNGVKNHNIIHSNNQNSKAAQIMHHRGDDGNLVYANVNFLSSEYSNYLQAETEERESQEHESMFWAWLTTIKPIYDESFVFGTSALSYSPVTVKRPKSDSKECGSGEETHSPLSNISEFEPLSVLLEKSINMLTSSEHYSLSPVPPRVPLNSNPLLPHGLTLPPFSSSTMDTILSPAGRGRSDELESGRASSLPLKYSNTNKSDAEHASGYDRSPHGHRHGHAPHPPPTSSRSYRGSAADSPPREVGEGDRYVPRDRGGVQRGHEGGASLLPPSAAPDAQPLLDTEDDGGSDLDEASVWRILDEEVQLSMETLGLLEESVHNIMGEMGEGESVGVGGGCTSRDRRRARMREWMDDVDGEVERLVDMGRWLREGQGAAGGSERASARGPRAHGQGDQDANEGGGEAVAEGGNAGCAVRRDVSQVEGPCDRPAHTVAGDRDYREVYDEQSLLRRQMEELWYSSSSSGVEVGGMGRAWEDLRRLRATHKDVLTRAARACSSYSPFEFVQL